MTCSLVAELDTTIAEHLAFSPVTINNGHTTFLALGLALIAAHPTHQKTGIGKAMIRY